MKGDVSVGDRKDMKMLEEYSKSTLTYMNECHVGYFKWVGSTHSEREVENDWEWSDTKIVSDRDRKKKEREEDIL